MKLAFAAVVIAAAVLGSADALDRLRRLRALNGSEETGEEVVPDSDHPYQPKKYGPCCSWDFATCGSSDAFCNAGQYQCEKSCEGHWIERVAESTECIPLWGECEPDSGGYSQNMEHTPRVTCCPIKGKEPSGSGYEGEGGYPICHTYSPGDYSQCIPADHQGAKDSSHYYGDVALEWNRVALQANILDHNGPIGSGGGRRKLYWGYNNLASDGGGPAPSQGPPGSARALAIIHLAMFEAYNCIEQIYVSYFEHDPLTVDCYGASLEVAIAQAAHDVMNGVPDLYGLYGHNYEITDHVDRALEVTLKREKSYHAKEKGIEVGHYVAMRVLQDRVDDGWSANDPYLLKEGEYIPTGELGYHDVDPLNPNQGFLSPGAGRIKPFTMSSDALRDLMAPEPPGMSSADLTMMLDDPKYLASLQQVKILGAFRGGTEHDPVPTDDETYIIANYWSANGSPYTGTPTTAYNDIARKIAIKMGNNLHDNILMFTIVNLALADTGISTWDAKFTYKLWRPILAIRNHSEETMSSIEDGASSEADEEEAQEDETVAQKDETEEAQQGKDTKVQEEEEEEPVRARRLYVKDGPIRDQQWIPLGASRSNPFEGEINFSPPFPGHTSGHAAFGCSVFQTLANFYQTYDIEFEYVSVEWNGETRDQFNRVRPCLVRHFDSIAAAMVENAASRVFNGVHYDFEGTMGCEVGMNVADYIYENLLLPKNNPTRPAVTSDREEIKEAIAAVLENSQTKYYVPDETCDAAPPYPYVQQRETHY